VGIFFYIFIFIYKIMVRFYKIKLLSLSRRKIYAPLTWPANIPVRQKIIGDWSA
jgi:hypothetical protein